MRAKKEKKIENFTIVHAILTIFSVNRSIIVFNVPWVWEESGRVF